ncbi:proteasome endopeptidase complex, putative [Trichomonas vaginalis G3]|uniref:Proteasome endopeptidase complex, putative n=1 Tax=Trichomonas vaginalis (strain ATCC PRA-98 / G3) TaxID=412133 RepID=A2DAK7_TRIV3|nr:26S proteasome regulatory subunit family [Trichomonas vaginalis G3]EAY22510.1 proteasome endopeptidase complex, putative [Trichomonas vaginalis G3]KAI5497243.1 26S proteasome regulatory subunit family [Trichomonas vaginalis G3]|eukprot:XP_001583496.1 proteasome endopeptidase complex [Trichomonas vaginalis G3]
MSENSIEDIDAANQEQLEKMNALTDGELEQQISILENQITVLKNTHRMLNNELRNMDDDIKSNREKVRLNKSLPYLVAHVVECFHLDTENENDNVYKGADNRSAVVKTTTRETVFLPVTGLIPADQLEPSDMVGLSKDSYLVFEKLPQHFDSRVKAMEVDTRPTETYDQVGGLEKQIQELKEAIVLPLTNPELFTKIGIQPPKGVLLFGPPGTGKTMLARACAASTNSTFLRLAGPQLVQMFVGEGSRLVRNAFELARSKAPAIIFIDEIDAIGSKRSDNDSLQGEREVQRTMLELLNQLDGFSQLSNVKVICATNRPDTLDPALMRSGRLDRKIELPIPNEDARFDILNIHSRHMKVNSAVNFRELARSTEDFNGAMLKAVCVEAGMVAMRRGADEIMHEDFIEGIAQVQSKKRTVLNYFA